MQDLGQLGYILGRGSGLSVEERGDSYFRAPEVRGNGFEGEALSGFGVKEGFGGGGEAGNEGCLWLRWLAGF
jgi:hypothetical protein